MIKLVCFKQKGFNTSFKMYKKSHIYKLGSTVSSLNNNLDVLASFQKGKICFLIQINLDMIHVSFKKYKKYIIVIKCSMKLLKKFKLCFYFTL